MTTQMEDKQIHKFDADINQLMKLIINSVYSDKEIFLRELISNSSDALDKIRYLSITDQEILKEESKLEINIVTDKQNNTITIQDTGIGMTKDELINNLGTIAKSGTKQFIDSLTASSRNDNCKLIGQFGVGFYSVFLVANRVDVITKSHNDNEYLWSSNEEGYTITDVEKDEQTLKRGTKIVLYLRDEEIEFLDEQRIKGIVSKHSQFVDHKISLLCEKTEEKEVEISDDEDDEDDDDEVNESEEVVIEEVKEEKTKKTKTITETRQEWDVLNEQKPIWIKNKSDVTDDEYNQFYKTISNDWDVPSAKLHFSVEGNTVFKSILFLPNHNQMNMYSSNKASSKIKLYVRRVFILDKCEQLMPEYLHFVTGIVDSDDLSLNISREILQKNNTIKKIRKTLVKKAIKMMEELSNDEESYNKFYKEFHKNIKWGINDDEPNREKLSKLVRYYTTTSGESQTSLTQYVENMKEDQKHIYYISGESTEIIKKSPFLETLNKKGYSVLLLTDAIDEYVVQLLKEFDGKKLIDVSKGNLDIDLTEDEQKDKEELDNDYDEMCKNIKDILGNTIEKVILSQKIVDSPCCISTTEYGWSANMARIMKAQALRDSSMNNIMTSKKIFELNPSHKTIKLLKGKYDEINDDDNNKKAFENIVILLYQTSQLVSGFTLTEPEDYSKKVYNLINLGLGEGGNEEEEEDNEDEQVSINRQKRIGELQEKFETSEDEEEKKTITLLINKLKELEGIEDIEDIDLKKANLEEINLEEVEDANLEDID